MLNRCFTLFLLLTIILTSCIVGTEVSIINQSKSDKSIRSYYPANSPFPITTTGGTKDSLSAYDISKTENAVYIADYYKYLVKIPIESLDTTARTYSFTLKSKHHVILMSQYPSIAPVYGQVFIIDNRDTIVLDRSGRFFKKRPKWGKGGSWTYKISDE